MYYYHEATGKHAVDDPAEGIPAFVERELSRRPGRAAGDPAAPEPQGGEHKQEARFDLIMTMGHGHDGVELRLDTLKSNRVEPAGSDASILRCVNTELDLERLSYLQDHLWMAGRPMPPRPLHHQQTLGRDIRITKRMDMHLVWATSAILVKPVPRFLLDPRFWRSYICCKDACCRRSACECRQRWRRTFGFLFSYAALVSHESDFRIAQEHRLFPPEVSGRSWRTLVKELLDAENVYAHVDPRFYYGELRLSRLNKGQYSSFLEDNFAAIATWTLYVAVVLAAMQVGLATEALGESLAFQAASCGFTVFSILGPLVGAGVVLLVFLYFFVSNWIATTAYWKKRMAIITARPEVEEEDVGSGRPPVPGEDHPDSAHTVGTARRSSSRPWTCLEK
ncbi:hypothetical protein CMUS01_05230 [Colletotrichum musicola]|uniref:Subtilisin-like serine protease n=1 Tax=Colletotrichum musicola TaxID=2175873 RepID=A0A8H6KTD0_9PEZI|nr:hypothetical protein CMUS01_05230 [Colletotrichum musicola]